MKTIFFSYLNWLWAPFMLSATNEFLPVLENKIKKLHSLLLFAAVEGQIYRGNKSLGFHRLCSYVQKESDSRWKGGLISKSVHVPPENHLKKGRWNIRKKNPKQTHNQTTPCAVALTGCQTTGTDGFPVKITGRPAAADWFGLCTRGCLPSLQRRCCLCLKVIKWW